MENKKSKLEKLFFNKNIMPTNNFIKKIKFNEDFAPFKKDDEIFFGGEKEVQNLIEFYLKNKPENKDKTEKEIKKNAERFKINCVLGNNWGGKSKLFEKINEIVEEYYFIIWWNENRIIKNVFDNFEILSNNSYLSINKKLLQLEKNKFYYDIYLFLEKYNKKDIFSNFLNLNKNFSYNLEIKFHVSNFKDFMIYESLKKANWWWIWFNFSEFLKNIVKLYDIFLKTKRNKFKIKLEKYFILNLEILLWTFHFLIESQREFFLNRKEKLSNKNIKVLSSLLNYFLEEINISNNFNKIFSENRNYLESWKENIFTFYNLFDISNFQEKLLEYKKNNSINIEFEIRDFSKYQDISFLYNKDICRNDLIFFDNNISKNFEELSSWEKTILSRFTNIYINIIEKYESWKLIKDWKIREDFVILIDEPDLHLHLDWQKKYIQKLIDVFSTLDTNIKLHFIIATHSPFIISDLPKECIIKLEGDWKEVDWNKCTKISYVEKNTFWANFVDIINDWFFFDKKLLMWSFAEKVIWELAELERKDNYDNDWIKSNIWNDFLKKNLIYFKLNKWEE